MVPDRVNASDRGPEKVAEGADPKCDGDGDRGDGEAGDRLAHHDAAAARDQGERRESAALAPLIGHRQDRDEGKNDGSRDADRGSEGAVGHLLDGREQDNRRRRQRRHDPDAGHEPEPGAGVEHLAKLSGHDPMHRDRSVEGPRPKRGAGRGRRVDGLGDGHDRAPAGWW